MGGLRQKGGAQAAPGKTRNFTGPLQSQAVSPQPHPAPQTGPRDAQAPAPAQSVAQALVLAAGRGERMRPLTDRCPKPLLPLHGQPLMAWSMRALARAGVGRIVVNTAWLGDQIRSHFGPALRERGCELGIDYSDEQADFGGALETLGGIVRALPRLDERFWVVAGDVFAPDFDFPTPAMAAFAASGRLAHLWLVPNPLHHPQGDFAIDEHGLARRSGSPTYTYSTIGLYHRALFAPPWCDIPTGNPAGIKAPLAPLLRKAMDNGLVSAEIYCGAWADVGTPERLQALGRLPPPAHAPQSGGA